MQFALHIEAGDAKGQTVLLGPEPVFVGRDGDCRISLADDQLVSRKHARFSVENEQVWVKNLGSLNGVYVNQALVAEKQALKPGDQIIIGNHLFLLKVNDATAEPQNVGSPPAKENQKSNSSQSFTGKGLVGTAKTSALDDSRRLRLLHQLHKATTGNNSVDHLLRLILNLIFQDLRVERGCIYLLNQKANQFEPKCFKIRGKEEGQSYFQPPNETLNMGLTEKKLVTLTSENIPGLGVHLSTAVPLESNQRLNGFIYLDTNQSGFSLRKGDLNFLESVANLGASAISKARSEATVRHQLEVINRLEKHVGSEIAQIAREKKIDLEESDLNTQEREVAILFSDIVGFTSMSERLSPPEIAFLLNGYFNHMSDCVSRYHGYLNKYIGDAVMAIFGAPYSVGNDSENAVRCAIDMLDKLREFWKTVDTEKRFKIRVGINTGIVTAGNIGSTSRMEYTVIGDAVNLASRLESKAEANSILIGETTYRKVSDVFPARQLGTLTVKGKAKPVSAFEILLENPFS